MQYLGIPDPGNSLQQYLSLLVYGVHPPPAGMPYPIIWHSCIQSLVLVVSAHLPTQLCEALQTVWSITQNILHSKKEVAATLK